MGGFGELMGSNGPQRFCIEKVNLIGLMIEVESNAGLEAPKILMNKLVGGGFQ